MVNAQLYGSALSVRELLTVILVPTVKDLNANLPPPATASKRHAVHHFTRVRLTGVVPVQLVNGFFCLIVLLPVLMLTHVILVEYVNTHLIHHHYQLP